MLILFWSLDVVFPLVLLLYLFGLRILWYTLLKKILIAVKWKVWLLYLTTKVQFSLVQFSSVAQSCPTPCSAGQYLPSLNGMTHLKAEHNFWTVRFPYFTSTTKKKNRSQTKNKINTQNDESMLTTLGSNLFVIT